MVNRRQLLKAGLALGGSTLWAAGDAFAAPAGYGIQGRYAPELQVNYWIDANGNETEAFKLANHANKWVLHGTKRLQHIA